MTCISINPVTDQIVAAVMPAILLTICILVMVPVFGVIREAWEYKDLGLLIGGIITGLLDIALLILLVGWLME